MDEAAIRDGIRMVGSGSVSRRRVVRGLAALGIAAPAVSGLLGPVLPVCARPVGSEPKVGRLRRDAAVGRDAIPPRARPHEPRGHPGAWRQQGYAIASAAVESAHHGVVQRRCKRPGQRWTVRGAQQILAARRLWCNRDSPADVTSVATVRHLVGPGYRRRAATAA